MASQFELVAKQKVLLIKSIDFQNQKNNLEFHFPLKLFLFLTHLGSMKFSSKLRSQTTMEAKRNAKNVLKLNSSKLAQRF